MYCRPCLTNGTYLTYFVHMLRMTLVYFQLPEGLSPCCVPFTHGPQAAGHLDTRLSAVYGLLPIAHEEVGK